MTKSSPLSVTVAKQSQAPDLSFLAKAHHPWIMGVLNATPDSFYLDSRVGTGSEALSFVEEAIPSGLDVLDLGAESTRPGSQEISAEKEIARLLPLLQTIRHRWPTLPLSIDTQKSVVALQALEEGAALINDISALRHDPEMVHVVAQAHCPVVLMHMQGTPQTMQKEPHYEDVVDEIKYFFEERLNYAKTHGISEQKIILDPGIGFGKTVHHNVQILKRLSEFLSLGRPLLVGVSRKAFIGKLLASGEGVLPVSQRLEGSIAAGLWAIEQGALGLRVHDVTATRGALTIWQTMRQDS